MTPWFVRVLFACNDNIFYLSDLTLLILPDSNLTICGSHSNIHLLENAVLIKGVESDSTSTITNTTTTQSKTNICRISLVYRESLKPPMLSAGFRN